MASPITLTTTMDLAGRIVIPKALRREARLRAGVPLRIELREGRGRARIVALTGEDGFTLVRTCADAGHTGGLLYDAHVAACARKAGARRILTFNRRDFERVAADFESVSP